MRCGIATFRFLTRLAGFLSAVIAVGLTDAEYEPFRGC
jgi:hypothetical protein